MPGSDVRWLWLTCLLPLLFCGCVSSEDLIGHRGAAPVGQDGGSNATLGPFGPPRLVEELVGDGQWDDDPSLTNDGLEIYFNSDRAGGEGRADIWMAKRSSLAEPWQTPAPVAVVNSEHAETTPGVVGNGLLLFFSSDRPGGVGGQDLWLSRRGTTEGEWSEPVIVDGVNTMQDEFAPRINGSRLELIFTRDTDAGPRLRLSQRSEPDAAWPSDVDVPGLAAELRAAEGILRSENRLLAFATPLPPAGWELVHAERGASIEPFSDFVPIVELNSGEDERDPWPLGDLARVFFTSHRSGSRRIYEATIR